MTIRVALTLLALAAAAAAATPTRLTVTPGRAALFGRFRHHDRDADDAGWNWPPFGGRGRGGRQGRKGDR